MKNLEDPQVIANDDILMLIVRAFSEDQNQFAGTGYDGGAGYQGLPGTVYLRSGIYMLISTDKGNNWGHWNGSTWNANQWLKIDEHQASTNSPATLEWPRVAWRNDYINGNEYGYIVWEKKVWSNPTQNSNKLLVNSATNVYLRAFNHEGKLVGNNTSLSFGGGCTNPQMPERPSVAIGPDNSVWISFYTLDYSANDLVKNGEQKPPMKVWLAKTIFNTSNNTFNLTGCAAEINPTGGSIGAKFAFGYYDHSRGYLYAGLGDGNGGTDTDWNIDLAQGPSVQVVCDKPTSCEPPYNVALLYTFSEDDHKGNSSNFHYRNRMSFNATRIKWGSTPANVEANWITRHHPVQDGSGWLATQVVTDPNVILPAVNSVDMVFFSTLKYTVIPDPMLDAHSFKTPDGYEHNQDHTTRIYPSHFLIAYFGADGATRSGSSTDNRKVGEVTAALGFSLDNLTFRAPKITGSTVSYEPLIHGPAFLPCCGPDVDPVNQFWGSKLDAIGDLSVLDFQKPTNRGAKAHIIVKGMRPHNESYTDWRLLTNTANIILGRAIVRGYAATDPEGFPKATTSYGGFFTESGTSYPWGDYVYFKFDDVLRPTSLNSRQPTITYNGTQLNYDTQVPESAASVYNGIHYGVYEPAGLGTPNEQVLGFLGTSNQRKSVMTGAIGHLVVEHQDKVYYSMQGERVLGSPEAAWTPPMVLSTPAVGVKQTRPSIAVYQQGLGTTPTGQAAIGVTWVEFSDEGLCSGENIGTITQTAFGTYNGGTTYLDDPDLSEYREIGGAALFANKENDYSKLSNAFWPGAYKIGTFDSAIGYELYRHEVRRLDTTSVSFVWGSVYVEDSANSLPERQVKLSLQEDSAGFTSSDQMRDSLFRTEWFEVTTSSQIRYWRGMFAHGGAAPVCFNAPGVRMQYTVVLEHKDGSRDTLERPSFAPYYNEYFDYGTISVPNLASYTDTVRLRVFGELSNIPDADSLVEFAYESFDGYYASAVDSTILNPNQQQMQMMMEDELEASGPYPNPSNKNVDNTSILVNLDELDEDIQVSVWTQGGIQVGTSHTVKSKKQWQKVKVKTPNNTGVYYIRVQANGKQVVLPMIVSN